MTTASENLRKLISESKIPMRRIARESNVPFFSLYNWNRGKIPHFDLDYGERVFVFLTGKKGFTR